MMIVLSSLLLLLLYSTTQQQQTVVVAVVHGYGVPAQNRRCAYGDPCWPSPHEWKAFNSTVSGRLIASLPSAAVCHDEHYDAELCAAAKKEWKNSFWRTAQVGAYAATLWEMGETDQCFISAPRRDNDDDDVCEAGWVPHYSVNATGVEDIQKAIRFAAEKELYLVIKNTGHSHLGRSSGKGAFSIWTHNLKGREWHDSFVVKGASSSSSDSGVPAVTLQAGEQWLDVYRDAAAHKRIIVGGGARTVGAAGGYMTGGGHSPWSHFYGLAVDNLLEATIVTPAGEHKTLNAHTDADYFWAIRGGGGSAWGVITSATYKTHPEPSHIQIGLIQFNATTGEDDDSNNTNNINNNNSNNTTSMRHILRNSLPHLPAITSAGYTGYATLTNGFSALFLQPNATNATFETTFAPLRSFAATQPNGTALIANFDLPSWSAYMDTFLSDPNIATNVIDSSRLLTEQDVAESSKSLEALIDLVMVAHSDHDDDAGAGFNYLGSVNDVARKSTAVHETWSSSFGIFSLGVDWADDASVGEKEEKRRRAVEVSLGLEKIVGRERGTYVNEANPFEPRWEEVFWGGKYERLERIKRRVDPRGLMVCNRCVGGGIVLKP